MNDEQLECVNVCVHLAVCICVLFFYPYSVTKQITNIREKSEVEEIYLFILSYNV